MLKKYCLIKLFFILILITLIFTGCNRETEEKLDTGDNLIDFTLNDLQSREVKISHFVGDYVLFTVWSLESEPGKELLFSYKNNINKLNQMSIIVIAISIDRKSHDLQEYQKKYNFPFIILQDEYNLNHQFWGIEKNPAVFLADKKGDILYNKSGQINFDIMWNDILKILK